MDSDNDSEDFFFPVPQASPSSQRRAKSNSVIGTPIMTAFVSSTTTGSTQPIPIPSNTSTHYFSAQSTPISQVCSPPLPSFSSVQNQVLGQINFTNAPQTPHVISSTSSIVTSFTPSTTPTISSPIQQPHFFMHPMTATVPYGEVPPKEGDQNGDNTFSRSLSSPILGVSDVIPNLPSRKENSASPHFSIYTKSKAEHPEESDLKLQLHDKTRISPVSSPPKFIISNYSISNNMITNHVNPSSSTVPPVTPTLPVNSQSKITEQQNIVATGNSSTSTAPTSASGTERPSSITSSPTATPITVTSISSAPPTITTNSTASTSTPTNPTVGSVNANSHSNNNNNHTQNNSSNNNNSTQPSNVPVPQITSPTPTSSLASLTNAAKNFLSQFAGKDKKKDNALSNSQGKDSSKEDSDQLTSDSADEHETIPALYNSELPPIENLELIDNIDNPFANINNNNNTHHHNNNSLTSINSLMNNNNNTNNNNNVNNISVNNVNTTANNNIVNNNADTTEESHILPHSQGEISQLKNNQSPSSSTTSSLESVQELLDEENSSDDSSSDGEDDLDVGDVGRNFHSFKHRPSLLERVRSEDLHQKRRGSLPSVSRKKNPLTQTSADLPFNKSFEYNAKGVKFYAEGKLEEADHYFSKAIIMKDHHQFYANRAAVKLKMKECYDALKDIERAIFLNPREAQNYIIRANIYFFMESPLLAGKILQDAMKSLTLSPEEIQQFEKGIKLARETSVVDKVYHIPQFTSVPTIVATTPTFLQDGNLTPSKPRHENNDNLLMSSSPSFHPCSDFKRSEVTRMQKQIAGSPESLILSAPYPRSPDPKLLDIKKKQQLLSQHSFQSSMPDLYALKTKSASAPHPDSDLKKPSPDLEGRKREIFLVDKNGNRLSDSDNMFLFDELSKNRFWSYIKEEFIKNKITYSMLTGKNDKEKSENKLVLSDSDKSVVGDKEEAGNVLPKPLPVEKEKKSDAISVLFLPRSSTIPPETTLDDYRESHFASMPDSEADYSDLDTPSKFDKLFDGDKGRPFKTLNQIEGIILHNQITILKNPFDRMLGADGQEFNMKGPVVIDIITDTYVHFTSEDPEFTFLVKLFIITTSIYPCEIEKIYTNFQWLEAEFKDKMDRKIKAKSLSEFYWEAFQDADSSDIRNQIDKFTNEFRKKPPPTLEEKAEKFNNFTQSILEEMKTISIWNMNARPKDEIDFIVFNLRKQILAQLTDLLHNENSEEDIELHKLIEKLHFITPEHLGLPFHDICEDSVYLHAKNELKAINDFTTPREKLECLLNCCIIINYQISSMGNIANADELLPRLILLIIHTNPPQLPSNLKFIQLFCGKPDELAEAFYYLTMFESAVYFIQHISAKLLNNISDDQFQTFMNAEPPCTCISTSSTAATTTASSRSDSSPSSPVRSPTIPSSSPPTEIDKEIRLSDISELFPDISLSIEQLLISPPQTSSQPFGYEENMNNEHKLNSSSADQHSLVDNLGSPISDPQNMNTSAIGATSSIVQQPAKSAVASSSSPSSTPTNSEVEDKISLHYFNSAPHEISASDISTLLVEYKKLVSYVQSVDPSRINLKDRPS